MERGFGYNQYPSDRFLSPTREMHYDRATLGSRGDRGMSPPGSPRGMGGLGTRGGRGGRGYKKERTCVPTNPTKRRLLFWGVPIGLLIAAGVALGVVFGIGKSKGGSGGGSGNGSGSGSGTGGTSGGGTGGAAYNATQFGVASSGGTGSTVTTDQGVQFTYQNTFGGYWAQNPGAPYSVCPKHSAGLTGRSRGEHRLGPLV